MGTGRYGINRNSDEEIAEEDCDKMMIETTKDYRRKTGRERSR
ncbi:MAG: hypothetical protein Pg6C_02420 [Treponemataceae bacterium]|nr:MAG: hypothetical protein Pg6C_02420 [Treponemataceae bacterium]